MAGCARLLTLGPDQTPTEDDLDLAMVLGGLSERGWFSGGKPPGHAYWARVWAARALTLVWSDDAAAAVVAALGDEAWRVREMAARVVAIREVDAADALVGCLSDDLVRVRVAAARALAVVGEYEHADALRDLAADPEPAVVRAGAAGLRALSRRIDRAV